MLHLRRQLRYLPCIAVIAVLTTCGGDVHPDAPGRVVVTDTSSSTMKPTTTTTTIDWFKVEQIAFVHAANQQNAAAGSRNVSRGVEAPRPVASDPVVAPSSCGNGTPPCYVCMRESHCTYGIVSTHYGCSGWHCYGKWQFDPTTWRSTVQRYGLAGIPEWPLDSWASVTPEMEDRVAAALWAGGAGCGHWDAC